MDNKHVHWTETPPFCSPSSPPSESQQTARGLPNPPALPHSTMDTRHVHWDEAPSFCSPPSTSSSELSESPAGPQTPPLPSDVSTPHIANALLPHLPTLTLPRKVPAGHYKWFWDMKLSSDTALLSMSNGGRQQPSYDLLASPATTPPLSSLTLHIARYPWTVTALPSIMPYVAVKDVLRHLYLTLHTSLSSEEVEAFGDMMPEAEKAYKKRIDQLQGNEKEEQRRLGVKRYDCFLGLIFDGVDLYPERSGTNEWMVYIRSQM
ncbi:hypothetical protein B0H21DRAFT_711902 [Amylocystis lapponica]|nr:hypothetical protein B0H21DRAFT_711902 [Amylocystis lapponica]